MTNQRVPPHRKATCHKGMPPLCRMLTGTMSVLRRNSTMNPRMLAAFREASSFLGWAPLITADFSTLRVGPGISGSLRKLPAAREFRYKASYLQCELAKHKGLWLCIACGYRIVGVCFFTDVMEPFKGGPCKIVIHGVKWGPCKWQKIHRHNWNYNPKQFSNKKPFIGL